MIKKKRTHFSENEDEKRDITIYYTIIKSLTQEFYELYAYRIFLNPMESITKILNYEFSMFLESKCNIQKITALTCINNTSLQDEIFKSTIYNSIKNIKYLGINLK